MHADERGDLHLLVQHRVLAVHRVHVGPPLHGLVRHAQVVEHRLVETMVAQQQLVEPLQEHAALGTLDDAVVVGAGDRDDLADAQLTEGVRVGTLELGRVVDAADADDDTLAGHEPRHALHGADGARVGEADRGALEVAHGELVALHLADELLVRRQEAGEVERVGIAQHRHDQRTRPVGLAHVDCETHVDVRVADETRLAVGSFGERVVHVRHRIGDRAHDRISDEVGEAHLALAAAAAVAVDDLAVHLEQFRRHVAEAGGGGHRQAALHVGGDCHARTTNRLTDVADHLVTDHDDSRRSRSRGHGCSRKHGWSGHGRGWHGRHTTGCSGTVSEGRRCRPSIVGEELLPRLAHGPGVGEELCVHFVDEPRVRSEPRPRMIDRSHRTRWYPSVTVAMVCNPGATSITCGARHHRHAGARVFPKRALLESAA